MDAKYIFESLFQAVLAGGVQVLLDRITSSDAVNLIKGKKDSDFQSLVKRLEAMMSSLTAVLDDMIAHEAPRGDSRASASEFRESKRPKIFSFSRPSNERDLENGIRSILDRLVEIVKQMELLGLKQTFAENMSVKKVAGVKKVFHFMDTSKGGKINTEELQSVLHNLGHQIPDADVQILMDAGDVDKDGSVDGREMAIDGETLRKAFDYFDIDGDGFIEIDELRHAFSMYEEDNTGYIEINELRRAFAIYEDEDIKEIMNAIVQDVDPDKEGQINYEEFVTMMKAGTDWRKLKLFQ